MSTLGQLEDDHKLLSGMIIHISDFSGTAKNLRYQKFGLIGLIKNFNNNLNWKVIYDIHKYPL